MPVTWCYMWNTLSSPLTNHWMATKPMPTYSAPTTVKETGHEEIGHHNI